MLLSMANETFQTEIGTTTELREIAQTVTACFFLVLIMIVALVGNIGVIMVVMLYRQMQKDISNMLLVNLSITDLTNTCLVMLSALVGLIADEWVFGTIWCDVICAMNYCLIIVSMLTLCCISLDRYQAIIHPLTYQTRVKRVTLLMAIIYSWIQGAVFSLIPPVLGWVDYDYWEAICAIQWHLYRPGTIVYVVSAFALCFLGPGIILCYCYVKIIKEVKNQAEHITIAATSTSKRKMSNKARIIWSLLVVVFAYFTCTAPFSVTKLIKVSVNDTSIIPGPINLSAALLGYMASAINPLIYGIFRKDFQRAYIQIIKMIFLGQRRTSTLDSMEFSTRVRSSHRPCSEEEKVNDTATSNGYTNGIVHHDSVANSNEIMKEGVDSEVDEKVNGYTNGVVHYHISMANSNEIMKEGVAFSPKDLLTSASTEINNLDTANDVRKFKEQNEKITDSNTAIEPHLVVNIDAQEDNNASEINTSSKISITTYQTQNCSNALEDEYSPVPRHHIENTLADTIETTKTGSQNTTSDQNIVTDETAFREIPNDKEILHDKSPVNKSRKGSIQTCTIANIDNKLDEISLDEIHTVTDLNSIDGSHIPNSSDSKISNGFVKIVRVNIECSIIHNSCDDLPDYQGSMENTSRD